VVRIGSDRALAGCTKERGRSAARGEDRDEDEKNYSASNPYRVTTAPEMSLRRHQLTP